MDYQQLIALAGDYERSNQLEGALAALEAAANLKVSLPLLMKIGQLVSLLRTPESAAQVYRQALALAPGSFDAAKALADALLEASPDESVAVLTDYMNRTPLPGQATAAAELASNKEWIARKRRGLPTAHVHDLGEFPFAFERDAVREMQRLAAAWVAEDAGASAYKMLGYGCLAASDIAGANKAFRQAGLLDPQERTGAIVLGARAKVENVLPPVGGEWPTEPGLFLACDGVYAKFFLPPLLRSLARFSVHHRVHVHIMAEQPPPDIAKAFPSLKITLTHENPLPLIKAWKIDPKTYYGAARLVRFVQALDVNDGPLWMSDIDGLVNRDPAGMFSTPGDIALRVRPGRLEPWNQFSACLVMGRPEGRRYFREVANIIAAALPHAFWGLDQTALFSAYLALQAEEQTPRLTLLGPEEAGVDDRHSNSVFWFTAGARKILLFARPPRPNPSPYEILFRACQGS